MHCKFKLALSIHYSTSYIYNSALEGWENNNNMKVCMWPVGPEFYGLSHLPDMPDLDTNTLSFALLLSSMSLLLRRYVICQLRHHSIRPRKNILIDLRTSQDLPNLGRLGHFLKGSSAAIGVNAVRNACEKIQHWGDCKSELEGHAAIDSKVALTNITKELEQTKIDYKSAEVKLRKFFDESWSVPQTLPPHPNLTSSTSYNTINTTMTVFYHTTPFQIRKYNTTLSYYTFRINPYTRSLHSSSFQTSSRSINGIQGEDFNFYSQAGSSNHFKLKVTTLSIQTIATEVMSLKVVANDTTTIHRGFFG